MAAFDEFMGSRSYIDGWSFGLADTEMMGTFTTTSSGGTAPPDPDKYPHAYRWYIHIAALSGVTRGAHASAAGPPVAAAVAPAASKKAGEDDNDDDGTAPNESRDEMLARLKTEALERAAEKEAAQRTLVTIEIKPWDVEQDLMALWKKITTEVKQDGLQWGEQCTLADVAYGIQKIQCTFTMGVANSSDDVVDAILAMEDEVQSCDLTSMNVL